MHRQQFAVESSIKQLLQQRLADCTLVKMNRVGHHILWQQTEATLRLVHAILDTLDDGG